MEIGKLKVELLIRYWEKEKSIMSKYYFQKQKKNKKAKQQYTDICLIDSYTRDFLLKKYFEKCNLQFTFNFFISRME